MAKSVQKIALSQSRDVPFNRLVLSQSNVRRIKAGVSIEELAQDIVRRTLLQSLTVRPVLDGDGSETGMFEVPAGGRRYRALELLVKQKRMAKTQAVPCHCAWTTLPQTQPSRRVKRDRCLNSSPVRRSGRPRPTTIGRNLMPPSSVMS